MVVKCSPDLPLLCHVARIFLEVSRAGDCDLNIVIRTAVYQDGVYHLGVGGGITCESDLEFEYEETLQKAKALLQAME